jgi:K(+)-stimulated pyrophosphate-energized sodium pump
MRKKSIFFYLSVIALLSVFFASPLLASEAELNIPQLSADQNQLLMGGLIICVLGMLFGLYMYAKVKRLPAHKCMLDVSEIIFQTCKTYLLQQGKLLLVLEIFIGACILYYFGFLQHMPASSVMIILAWSIIGILGSYGVAWFGIRMNT